MMARRPSLLSAEMAAGGHDKMFVLPPPSELVCKSCDLIAKNPCKTQCDCRGVYCSGCVADLQGKCPTCEKLVQPTNDLVSAHRIFTLPVKCDNAENGCVWIGDLGQLDSHILACPKQQIHCPYHMLGCRKQLPRGELDAHNESCVHKHLRLAVLRLERLESKIQVPPLVFQLTDFNRRLQLNHEWHSAPFYTHPTGYRMCLRVNARGDGVGRGTHVSLYVCLMQGCNDDGLAWPFRGEVTLELLNQLQDNGHKQETIHFTNTSASEVNSRVRGRERSERGRGLQLFMPHSKLGTNESTQKCHLKNDCLFFRASGATVYTSNTPWLTVTLSPA